MKLGLDIANLIKHTIESSKEQYPLNFKYKFRNETDWRKSCRMAAIKLPRAVGHTKSIEFLEKEFPKTLVVVETEMLAHVWKINHVPVVTLQSLFGPKYDWRNLGKYEVIIFDNTSRMFPAVNEVFRLPFNDDAFFVFLN